MRRYLDALRILLQRSRDSVHLDWGLALLASLGAAASLASAVVSENGLLGNEKEEPSLEARIDSLASSLTEASNTITAIEREIESRQELVLQLREDAETHERLADLHRDEVEAVTQALEGELEEDRGRSFWQNFAMNFGFFALGAITSVLIALRLNRRGGRDLT